jgi:hypothetical protein
LRFWKLHPPPQSKLVKDVQMYFGASPSLGGTTRNFTLWFSWTHWTLKNHRKHLNEHFHNFLKKYTYYVP